MTIKPVTDPAQWDNWVQSQPYTSHFLSWSWSQFQNALGYQFKTYGIFQNNRIAGVIPINYIKARRGAYLHLRHGPLLDWRNQALVETFMEFIYDYARKHKAWFIRISPLVKKSSPAETLLRKNGFIDSPIHNRDAELAWVLPLNKRKGIIFKNMRKSTKYCIKKAQKKGVKIVKTADNRYFPEFWRIYQDTVKRQQWTAYSNKYLKTEYQIFTKNNQALMFLAEYQKKFIAAAIFIYYGNQAIYHHSGSLTQYHDISASHLLQWEAIQESIDRGLDYHNFWGISAKDDQKHPWAGLSLFKRGFGGQAIQFAHAKDYRISNLYYATRVFEWLEKKRRGY